MAIKDRVMAKPVGSGIVFNTATSEEMVLVYKPVMDSKNNYVFDSGGGVIVERVGGVRAGSTGTIMGPSVRVPRKLLLEYKEVTAAMGTDLIDMYPVQFDAYSGIGFLCGDSIKII